MGDVIDFQARRVKPIPDEPQVRIDWLDEFQQVNVTTVLAMMTALLEEGDFDAAHLLIAEIMADVAQWPGHVP